MRFYRGSKENSSILQEVPRSGKLCTPLQAKNADLPNTVAEYKGIKRLRNKIDFPTYLLKLSK